MFLTQTFLTLSIIDFRIFFTLFLYLCIIFIFILFYLFIYLFILFYYYYHYYFFRFDMYCVYSNLACSRLNESCTHTCNVDI